MLVRDSAIRGCFVRAFRVCCQAHEYSSTVRQAMQSIADGVTCYA